MRDHTKLIIQRIGETDQLYLQGNSPELSLERAELRLQLVTLSQMRQEQIHFLQEAVVLLEQSRIDAEEMPFRLPERGLHGEHDDKPADHGMGSFL